MKSIIKKALILPALLVFFFLSAQNSIAVDCNPYPPLTGTYTITTTPSCSFVGTPNGADNGGITVSTGVNLIIPASSVVTWSSGQSITLNGTASVSINASGGQFSQTNLWMVDADGDGWPVTSAQTSSANSPGGTYSRRYTLNSGCFNTATGAWTLDCNDASYSLTNSCCVGNYGQACTTCNATCTSRCNSGTILCAGGCSATDPGVGLYGQACSSCNACGSCNNGTYTCAQSCSVGAPAVPTWYQDSDGDGYGNPGVPTSSCSQPGGYVSNASDCYDSNANAHPGQTNYFATNRGDGSFDYNCNGTIDHRDYNCGFGAGLYSVIAGECTGNGWKGTSPTAATCGGNTTGPASCQFGSCPGGNTYTDASCVTSFCNDYFVSYSGPGVQSLCN